MRNLLSGKLKTILVLVMIICFTSLFTATAQTICNNSVGTQGSWTYEYWKDSGDGCMVLGPDGSFSIEWSNIHNLLARKGVRPGGPGIVVDYSCDYNPDGHSYMCVYGWTKSPLVEYYIVDDWKNYRPPDGEGFMGTVISDGGTYDIYKTMRYNQPSIEGTKTFPQFWSVRQSTRTSGTITCANHFNAWADLGMNMGNFYEVSFCIEGWQSSGSANVTSLSMSDGPTTPSPVPTPDQTLVPTPTPGNGNGLTGEYYNNLDFTNLALTRVDQTIDFDWVQGSPDSSIDPDTYSIRWKGKIEPHFSEDYTFYTTTDDGVRLRVNNQLIIDHWVQQAATEVSGSINLNAGTHYDIEMEYYEDSGEAVAQLSWSSPNQPKEIIPMSQLFSDNDQGTLGDVDSDGTISIIDALLVAQYYVGLNPEDFNPAVADTDCSGDIDIVDALLIAQYYVGLITSFC